MRSLDHSSHSRRHGRAARPRGSAPASMEGPAAAAEASCQGKGRPKYYIKGQGFGRKRVAFRRGAGRGLASSPRQAFRWGAATRARPGAAEPPWQTRRHTRKPPRSPRGVYRPALGEGSRAVFAKGRERPGQAAKHHCPAAPRSRIAQTYQARRTPHKLYTSCAEKPSERASTQRGAACPSVQDPPPAATAAAPLTAAAAPDRSSRCSSPHFPPRRRSRTCAPACAAPTRRPGRRRSSRPRLLEGSPPIRFHPT